MLRYYKEDITKSAVHSDSRWFEYQRYVQSHTRMFLWSDGRWHISTKFSNGDKLGKVYLLVIFKALKKTEANCSERYMKFR